MQSFKPAPVPLGTRLLSNSALIAGLVILSLILGVLFLINQRQSFFSESSIGTPIVLERRELRDDQDDGLDRMEDQSSENFQDEPPPDSTESTALAQSDVVAQSTTSTTPAQSPLQIKMTFLELPADLASLLIEELASTPQFMRTEEFTIGVAENISAKLQRRAGLQVLELVEKKLEGERKSAQWFSGVESDGAAQNGLSFFFEENTTEPKSENIFRIDFEILKSFLEPGLLEPSKSNLPGSIDLSSNQALVIMGGLPRNLNIEDGIRAPAYFKIFQSPFYRNRQSEFTIVIEFVRSKP